MNYKEYALALEAKNQTEVIYWIEHNLANYLKNNIENQDDIEHIIDYLSSDDAPKNIIKMSYSAAQKNTEEWTKKLIKKGEHIKEVATDTEVVLDFKDGFKIVKLIGKNAYEREGYLMRHCVASYYGSSKEIYSLRDKDNMPHCTMEHDQQVKGKGNGNIHPKYVGYIVQFLEYIGMTVGDSEMDHLGYINIEKFKEYLSDDTKFFNKKYIPDNEPLINKEGKEFASLDLLDVKPLIKESIDTELEINFNLEHFIKLSIEFLFKYKKAEKELIQSSENDYAQLAASGHYARLAASGHSAQLAASGDSAQLAASGHSARLAASGHSAQLAASGHYARLAASGHSARLAASGDSAQLAASGHSARLAASGHSARLAASGDSAQLAASGHYARLAASGHSARLAASGHSAQLAASGHYARLAASGHSAQLAASGDSARLAMEGGNSVGANISYNGKIKGKKGDWITLAEYDLNDKPLCVKSAQIDGEIIKEDIWYQLKSGEFTEVE
jgi:hypothetical protein